MAYRVLSPETVTIGEGVEIGDGAIIFPNNHLFGSTKIGAGAVLYPNNILEDTTVGDGASVTASVARGAVIGRGTEVGPFANLRPGANVGTGCRVGDFVEIKKRGHRRRVQGQPPRVRRGRGSRQKLQHRLRRGVLQL